MKAQRSTLRRIVEVLDGVSPGVSRVVGEETGVDVSGLIEEANRVLG
jgi:hypothetical protein